MCASTVYLTISVLSAEPSNCTLHHFARNCFRPWWVNQINSSSHSSSRFWRRQDGSENATGRVYVVFGWSRSVGPLPCLGGTVFDEAKRNDLCACVFGCWIFKTTIANRPECWRNRLRLGFMVMLDLGL